MNQKQSDTAVEIKLGDRVVTIPMDEFTQEDCDELGVGTVVNIPTKYHNYDMLNRPDITWVKWDKYDDPKWIETNELALVGSDCTMKTIDELNEAVSKMPPELQDIHYLCWDETGRPRHNESHMYAFGELLKLSNTFDEFANNCKILFVGGDVNKDTTDQLILIWYSHIIGIKKLASKLGVAI